MAALMTLRAVHLPPREVGTLRSFSALACAAAETIPSARSSARIGTSQEAAPLSLRRGRIAELGHQRVKPLTGDTLVLGIKRQPARPHAVFSLTLPFRAPDAANPLPQLDRTRATRLEVDGELAGDRGAADGGGGRDGAGRGVVGDAGEQRPQAARGGGVNEDMLLTFRTLSREWADQARAEAKAAIAAFDAGAGGATEAVRRLSVMVEQIHANCARTLDGLHAALTNDSLAAESDDLAQIKDLAEDIAVLDKEMDDLVRATSVVLQAGVRR